MANEHPSLLLQAQDWLLRRIPPSGVRRVLPVSAALGSDVGSVRKENQDRVALARGRNELGRTYVVTALADGIGGMKYGAQCAALAVSAVIDSVNRSASNSPPSSEWAANAMSSAHNAVQMEYGGMGGATLVVLLIAEDGHAYWASVGDSRLYISKGDALLQLSTDDTIAGQLGRPAGSDIDQGKLLQYIGMEGSLEFEVSTLRFDQDQTAILTTDGVHFLASGSDVMSLVIRNAPDIGTAVRRLTELARWSGGPDNATVAIIALDTTFCESLPPYRSLEIWDPFGEIRLPLTHFSNQQDADTVSNSMSPRTSKNKELAEDDSVTEKSVAERKDVSNRARGSKGKQRKRKPKVARDKSAPQVQLEFSDKKS